MEQFKTAVSLSHKQATELAGILFPEGFKHKMNMYIPLSESKERGENAKKQLVELLTLPFGTDVKYAPLYKSKHSVVGDCYSTESKTILAHMFGEEDRSMQVADVFCRAANYSEFMETVKKKFYYCWPTEDTKEEVKSVEQSEDYKTQAIYYKGLYERATAENIKLRKQLHDVDGKSDVQCFCPKCHQPIVVDNEIAVA